MKGFLTEKWRRGMDKNARYAAVNTKVMALEGRLLNDEDYNNLLSQSSISDVVGYLKYNTHYGEILRHADTGELHREKLEYLIKESNINSLKKLSYHLFDGYREFFNTLFIKYEIESLKVYLRRIKSGSDYKEYEDSADYLGKPSRLDVKALSSSGSIAEFIENLKGTIYYDYLHPFIGNGNDIELFNIEMVLDLAYFDLFYKNLRLIDDEDRKIAGDIEGANVDLLNLQWIYRGLKFYRLSPEELFNYTIAYGKEFSRDSIKKLCYVKNIDELQKLVSATKYGFLFDYESPRDIFMERRLLRYQYLKLKKAKARAGMNISQLMVFSMLQEMEVRDIITIIESIRYEMPVEEARRFLIRKL